MSFQIVVRSLANIGDGQVRANLLKQAIGNLVERLHLFSGHEAVEFDNHINTFLSSWKTHLTTIVMWKTIPRLLPVV